MSIEELKAEDHLLYLAYAKAKELSDSAAIAWGISREQIERIEKKEAIRKEPLAELKAEQEAAK